MTILSQADVLVVGRPRSARYNPYVVEWRRRPSALETCSKDLPELDCDWHFAQRWQSHDRAMAHAEMIVKGTLLDVRVRNDQQDK